MATVDLTRPLGTWRIPLLIVLAVAMDVAFGLVYLADRLLVLLDLGLPYGVSRLIDLDGERNLPTWYSSIKLFVVGALMAVLTLVFIGRGVARAWLMGTVSLAMIGMSVDEFAGIHERLSFVADRYFLPGGDRQDTALSATGIWPVVIALPVLVALTWAVLAMRRLWNDARATRLFVIGVVVFIGSAGGTELLVNVVSGTALTLQVVAEECGEMLGVTIILWATLQLLKTHRIALFATESERPIAPADSPTARLRVLKVTDVGTDRKRAY